MKEFPKIAGWPTQTSLVREQTLARKKRRSKKHPRKG